MRKQDGKVVGTRPEASGGWRWEVAFAVAVFALLACGSLTPFVLDPRRAALGVQWGQLGWPTVKLDDVITNLLVYLPVGAAWVLLLRRWMPTAVAAVGALVGGLLLSFTFESLQTVIATRYASWHDVALNCLGALVGAAVTLAVDGPVRRGAALLIRFVRSCSRLGWPVDVGLLACWGVMLAATGGDGVRGLAGLVGGEVAFRMTWLPLIDYFYVPFGVALAWAGDVAATYAALTWTTLAVAARWRGPGLPWSRAVVPLAMIVGVLGILEASGRASISDGLIALLAVGVAGGIARVLMGPVASNPARRAISEGGYAASLIERAC